MALKQHIQALEELLNTTTSFSKAAEYFLDHLGENEDFLKQGKIIEHDALESILAAFAKRLANVENATGLHLMKSKHGNIIHGFCWLGNRNTTLFYFDKSDIGLLIVAPVALKGDTDFFRFRILAMTANDEQHHIQTAPGMH